MTPEKETAMRDVLMQKSVGELINIIISDQEELEEAKKLRRRITQIRNLALDPEERRKPGRPQKTSDNR